MNHRLFARSAMLTSLMLALVFGAAALFAVQNLFGGSLALLLSGGNYELMLPSSLVFSVVVAVVTFLLFFQLLCNRFSRVFLLCATVAYLLGIAWVVFFKSIGIRGVNLDPIDFFYQLLESPGALLVNLMLFAPLGAMLRMRCERMVVALLGGVALSSSIEVIQYIFSLGICDVVDVMMNVLGVVIGFLVADVATEYGYHVVAKDDGHFSIEKGASARWGKHAAKMIPRSAKLLSGMAILCMIVVVTAPVVHGVISSREIEDFEYQPGKTLGELPLRTRNEPLSNAPVTVVDGLEVESDGTLNFSGLVNEALDWAEPDGNTVVGVELVATEEISGGLVVSHVIPAVLDLQADIKVGERDVALEEALELLQSSTQWTAQVTCTIEDGWINVEHLWLCEDMTNGVDPRVPLSSFSWEDYDVLESSAKRGTWLTAPQRDLSSVEGFASSFSQSEGEPARLTLCVPDGLFGVPILHVLFARTDFDHAPSAQEVGSPTELRTFDLSLSAEGDSFVLEGIEGAGQ